MKRLNTRRSSPLFLIPENPGLPRIYSWQKHVSQDNPTTLRVFRKAWPQRPSNSRASWLCQSPQKQCAQTLFLLQKVCRWHWGDPWSILSTLTIVKVSRSLTPLSTMGTESCFLFMNRLMIFRTDPRPTGSLAPWAHRTLHIWLAFWYLPPLESYKPTKLNRTPPSAWWLPFSAGINWFHLIWGNCHDRHQPP